LLGATAVNKNIVIVTLAKGQRQEQALLLRQAFFVFDESPI